MRMTPHALRRHSAYIGILLHALAWAPGAFAANWLMLQGTEPKNAPKIRVFGFVSAEYQRTSNSPIAEGPWKGQPLVLNRIPPDLKNSAAIQFPLLRVGIRGRLLDGKLNYWASPLAGDNAISKGGNPNLKFTDVSATFNLIPHARVRVGQFKTPGQEEGITPARLRDYVNPAAVSRQVVNERHFNSDGTRTDDDNQPDGEPSGFRDLGVQVFDAFKTDEWEHTYAVMAGSGEGLALYRGTGSGRPDWYAYWSSEWVIGGKGPFRDGFKLFVWYQNGERDLRVGQAQQKEDFDRERYGIGATYRRGPWRGAAEWVGADGVIFNGTDSAVRAGARSNNGRLISSFNVLPDDEANGWYLDLGYTFFQKWEIRGRYDRLDRGTKERATERRFQTMTVGLTYRHNKALRLLADYEFRDVEAPRLSGNAVPNKILDKVNDLVAVRVYYSF